MMINKDKDFLNSLESVSGSKLDDDLLAKVIEESGSTFGDIVDSLIKTFASRCVCTYGPLHKLSAQFQ